MCGHSLSITSSNLHRISPLIPPQKRSFVHHGAGTPLSPPFQFELLEIARYASSLVFGRHLLNVVDDNHGYVISSRFEFEPQLLLYRRENIG